MTANHVVANVGTGNRELAARALAVADKAMRDRQSALVVSVALTETTTIAAARKVIGELAGTSRASLMPAAGQLLDMLTAEPEDSP